MEFRGGRFNEAKVDNFKFRPPEPDALETEALRSFVSGLTSGTVSSGTRGDVTEGGGGTAGGR